MGNLAFPIHGPVHLRHLSYRLRVQRIFSPPKKQSFGLVTIRLPADYNEPRICYNDANFERK